MARTTLEQAIKRHVNQHTRYNPPHIFYSVHRPITRDLPYDLLEIIHHEKSNVTVINFVKFVSGDVDQEEPIVDRMVKDIKEDLEKSFHLETASMQVNVHLMSMDGRGLAVASPANNTDKFNVALWKANVTAERGMQTGDWSWASENEAREWADKEHKAQKEKAEKARRGDIL